MTVIKRNVGCSAFGLNDSTVIDGQCNSDVNFQLADVLLPSDIHGTIVTGPASKASRLDTGLPWPLEARVGPGQFMRRVPISMVWRALVEAEDSPVRWSAGQGLSFPLAKILGRYIKGQVRNTESKPCDRLVVAIPNDLDEYGQDCLLRDLRGRGYEEPILVWRPVAAALAWLKKTQIEFVDNQISEQDHIHVIYLGPDAIEFTTFQLKTEERSGEFFVVPRRNRTITQFGLTGFDWAGVVIEDAFGKLDEGRFWQIFCQFPDVWAALADSIPNPTEKERLLGNIAGWELWDPSLDLIRNTSVSAVLGPCKTLRNLLKQSCKLRWPPTEDKSTTWHQKLESELSSLLDASPDGRLRGLVVCGPLAPVKIPIWIEAIRDKLHGRGLIPEFRPEALHADTLWLTPGSTAIARGASIYGQRLDAGKPTYKDTLPTLSVWVRDGWRHKWVPLIDATAIDGGQTYYKKWENRFQLGKDKRELTVHLKRGTSTENGLFINGDAKSSQENRAYDLSPCSKRVIRVAIRSGWNEQEISKVSYLGAKAAVASYGQSFSQSFYGTQHSQEPTSCAEEKKSLLRSFTFSFPLPPPSNMPVNAVIRIKPASGFATVELIPENPSFLQGRQVFLNFEQMNKVDDLPKERRGWPELDELCAEPADSILLSQKTISLVEKLECIDIFKKRTDIWCQPILNLLKKTLPLSRNKTKSLVCYAVDRDGKACTQEGNSLVARVADKLGSHFCDLYNYVIDEGNDYIYRRGCYPKLFDLVIAGSLLFGKTPPIITSFLRNVLVGRDRTMEKWGTFETKQKLFLIAAGRCFITPADYRILFESVCDRIENVASPGNFTIQAASGCLLLLRLRPDAPEGLNSRLADILIQTCLGWLESEDSGKKLKAKFFRVIWLMLYLLRFRERNEDFLNPDASQTKDILYRFETFMDDAVERRVDEEKKDMAVEVKEGFVRYVNYEGTSETVETLRLLSEEEVDN